ncbi:MAG: hypothetical protein ACLFSZ_11080 [Puniceicoccaceae bacterium]
MITKKTPITLTLGILFAAFLTPVLGQKQDERKPSNYRERPAVFTVTPDVLIDDLPPFTATTGTFGNTLIHLRNGAFEPYQWRDRIWARRDDPNRIHTEDISANGRFASGFLDGAQVMVFRPLNGKMKLVRRDTVAPGGSVIEYWQHWSGQTVRPDTRAYTFQWPGGMEPGADIGEPGREVPLREIYERPVSFER